MRIIYFSSVILFCACSVIVTAQQKTAAVQAGQQSRTTAKQPTCIEERKVLRDGTSLVHRTDCTTKVIFTSGVSKEVNADSTKETDTQSSEGTGTSSSAATSGPLAPRKAEALDNSTTPEYLKATKAFYENRILEFTYRQQVFNWQLLSSKIIFVVVMLLVASGIYFAAIQFHVGLRRKPEYSAADEGLVKDSSPLPQATPDVTTIVASLKGIKVSSSVLGVIILTLSLAFMYLYLYFVYPIHEIKPSP